MNYKHILLSLIIFATASCSEDNNILSNYLSQEVRVTAGIGINSRTVLSNQGNYTNTLWQNGDKISLYTSTQKNLVYSTSLPQDSVYAEFTPIEEKLQYIEGNKVYATYPETTSTNDALVVNLPSTKTLEYNNGSICSFGYAVGNISRGGVDFTFHHISAFLCLTLTPEMFASATSNVVGSISVSSTSSAPLSVGEGDTFDFSTLTAKTTSGSNTVEVTSINHTLTENWTVYIPVLPQPADATLTITVAGNDGSSLYTMSKTAPATGFLAGNVYRLTLIGSGTTTKEEFGAVDLGLSVKWANFNLGANAPEDYGDYYAFGELEPKTEYTSENWESPGTLYLSSNYDAATYQLGDEWRMPTQAEVTELLTECTWELINIGDILGYRVTGKTGNSIFLPLTGSWDEIPEERYENYEARYRTSEAFLEAGETVTDPSTYVLELQKNFADTEVDYASGWKGHPIRAVYPSEKISVENAYLCDGQLFNLYIKQLANNNTDHYNYDDSVNIIKRIEFKTEMQSVPLKNIDVSATNSEVPIYASFSEQDSLLTVSTSAKNIIIVDGSNLFSGLESLYEVAGDFEITENTTNMQGMFSSCKSLSALNCANWNTSNVTNIAAIFQSCYSLVSLDVSNWDTSNVMNMNAVFDDCSSLTILDVSKWNTSNVTKMQSTFSSCSSLTSLDISNWQTEKVTDMSFMFWLCNNLRNLDVYNWNVSNVESMMYMFYGCKKLSSLNIPNWNVSNVKMMSFMFMGCEKLTSLDIPNWNASNVESMMSMFGGCYNLSTLNIANWKTSKLQGMSSMFKGCSQLTQLDMSNWDVTNVTDVHNMFYGCRSLISLKIPNWSLPNVTDMHDMFYECKALLSLDVSNWNVSNAVDMERMFYGCKVLSALDVSKWDTENVINMHSMFYGCEALSSLDVSNWNTKNVTDMGYLFLNCRSLTYLDAANWDTSKVTAMSAMFSGCESLSSLNTCNWNISNVTEMSSVFDGCYHLVQLDISNWNLNENVSISDMFVNCAYTSKSCEITATQATQDFLLGKVETTKMEPSYFIWVNANAGSGNSFEDIPNQGW